MHIWVIRHQWVNSLRPSDAHMRGNLAVIGSDNGLSPSRRQAIIWTNAGILLIGPLGTNFSENLIGIQTFSFKKLHLKTSSAKWRLFCIGLSPGRRQAIIWTNAGISLIAHLWTDFSEILIGIQTFSFTKLHLKTSSAKWRLFCLGLNELNELSYWGKNVALSWSWFYRDKCMNRIFIHERAW